MLFEKAPERTSNYRSVPRFAECLSDQNEQLLFVKTKLLTTSVLTLKMLGLNETGRWPSMLV